MPDQATAAERGHLAGHAQQPELEPQPRRRRRRWWLTIAAAMGLLLCVQPLFSGNDEGSAPSTSHPDTSPDGHWSIGTASPTVDPARPTTTPTAAPTSAAATRPAPTGSAGASRSPVPVLLGPADGAGVRELAEEYCEQHVSGSVAAPRADGRWQCVRLLVFVKDVDMDVACADAYGKDAFAQNPDPDDAHAWRCYQR